MFTTNIPVDRSKRTLWFIRVLKMRRQCYWYGVIYYLKKMRFTSPSNAWKKYVHWFNIIRLFYIFLAHVWTKSTTFFCFEFQEFMPLRLYYLLLMWHKVRDWKVCCLFLCLLSHFHWDILSLVFHYVKHGIVRLDC